MKVSLKALIIILPSLLSACGHHYYAQVTDNSQPPASGWQNQVAIQPAETSTKPAVVVNGQVTRALFTTDVKNREPVNNVTSLTNDTTRVIYFTEIHDMTGQTVSHRWEYQGKVMLEKSFEVGAAHWRVYSTKTLDPSWLGDWKASAVDAAGSSLSINTFSYMNQSDAAAVAPKPAR